jgi:ABC-type transport system involved in multi-copper enzyme maturation permease subunit
MSSAALLAVARLDLGEILRSRWLLVAVGVYLFLGGLFVLVGLRESSVLGFTGMGRVLFSLCHALVLLLPLLALLATVQVVNRARDDGTLELLLSHPVGRGSYVAGTTAVRVLALVVPLVLVLVGLSAAAQLGAGQPVPWGFLARALGVSATLIGAYVGVGMAISVLVRNPARAVAAALLVWAASVALLDFALIGLLLRWQLPAPSVFLLAALNPVGVARLALLSAAEPDLGTFGPVGFYLATRVGAAKLLAFGTAWPALVGLAGTALAHLAFRRGDAV